MILRRLLLPSWRVVGYTDLTHEQFGQRLSENILTGFSLHSTKPYYGSFTPDGFQARRRHSTMKSPSLLPTVRGTYGQRDGLPTVTIEAEPHTLFRVLYALYVGQSVFFWFIAIMDIPHMSDFVSLFRGLLLPMGVAVFLWLIFKRTCGKDIHYWKGTLGLREVPA